MTCTDKDSPKGAKQAPCASALSGALNKYSLKAAGYAALVGDAALFASGMMSGRRHEALAGLSIAAGGLVLARYGKQDAEWQCSQLSRKLHQHLRKQQVDIPKRSELHQEWLEKPEGWIEQVEDFLYRNPSEVLNVMATIGGVQLARSGLQHHKQMDVAAGVLVSGGALASLLIPERDIAEEEKSRNPIVRSWQWIQEKPLRATGYVALVNDAFLVGSAMKEHKANPEQKSYLFKYVTAAAYAMANLLIAHSKKNRSASSGKQEEISAEIVDRAASVIAAQPKQTQDMLIHDVSCYLASQSEISMNTNEIAATLHDYMDQRRQSSTSWRNRLDANGTNNGVCMHS